MSKREALRLAVFALRVKSSRREIEKAFDRVENLLNRALETEDIGEAGLFIDHATKELREAVDRIGKRIREL